MEFHISRHTRRRYKFDDSLFSFNGHAIFANFHAARVFTQRMNEKRDLKTTLKALFRLLRLTPWV